MLTITEKAAEMLKETLSKQENPDDLKLRVSFNGFGWGGPKLSLTLDELTDQNDQMTEAYGVTIVYDKDIEKYVQNSVIDYSTRMFNKGFLIRGAGLSSC